jgi:adenosylcobinamide-GDP ribazoletransferase
MGAKRDFLSDLKSAILFITILPAGKDMVYSPMGMIRFFPLVGLIIGAILAIGDLLFSRLWTEPVVAVLDMFILIVVTGAFHIDGLGDTADGLFSHRSKQRALEIMKDSRTGMMGLVAVISILTIKLAGIYSLKLSQAPSETLIFLFIIPSFARSGMLFGIKTLDYGRKDTGGTGLDLFEDAITGKDFIWLILPCVISLFSGIKGPFLILLFIITVFLITVFYKKKMGCVTGDMLGAMTEVTEAVLFLGAGASFL